MARVRSVAATLVLISAAATSCSALTSEGMVLDRVREYHSVDELLHDSSLVIVGTASDDTSEEAVAGITFTAVPVTVDRVLRGATAEKTIRVRLAGSKDMTVEGQTWLEPGHTYLLFLAPFDFERGVATGQYATVGLAAGVYQQISGTRFARTSHDDLSLPATIDTTAL